MSLLFAPLTPLPAHASVTSSGVCQGTLTLTFTAPNLLTAVPAIKGFTVKGGGTCLAPSGASVSWQSSVSFNLLPVSCADIAGEGGGTISVNGGAAVSVLMALGGPTPAEDWAAVDSSGASVVSDGVFAWTNTDESSACLGSGTATVTLTGYFVVAVTQ